MRSSVICQIPLKDHQLYAKFTKYEFCLDSMIFVGQVISKDGIKVDPTKVVIVHDWARPNSYTEIHSFTKLVGY